MAEESQKPKVLLVDDDQFLLKMYVIKFNNAGFDIEAVTGGEEALNKLKEGFIPDVLILDIIMPGMDGIDLLGNIEKDKLAPDAAVVMLTNQSSEKEVDRVKEHKIDSYIVKATTVPSEVVEQIKNIIEGKKNK